MQLVHTSIGSIIMLAFWLALYFLPTVIARKKVDAKKIAALNLFLGWTVIGWIASLIWALKINPKVQSTVEANINANNIALLEKLSNLYKDGIITEEELAIQKQRLLGVQIEVAAPQKNSKLTIAMASIFLAAFMYTSYAFFTPFFYNEQTAVTNFLCDVQNQNGAEMLEQADEYNDVLRQKNILPKISSYVVLSSQKIKNHHGEEIYNVYATVINDDNNKQLVQNVNFLVEKRGFAYYIKNSFNFLNTGTNQVAFPDNMGDIKRLEIAQQLNLTIELVSSTCNISNGGAQGKLQVKNNYHLPVKNVQVQVQYINKQQQTVKTQTVGVLGNNDELQPQEIKIANWVTPDCKDCNTVNVTLVKQHQ